MTGLPERMSGVVLTRHGGPEALMWRDDLPVPRPGAGQVLVQVLAAGVNNTDINTRIGWYARDVTGATNDTDGSTGGAGWAGALAFPRIQGGDLCGRVVGVGAGVSAVAIGQRVTCQINLPRPTAERPFGILVLGSDIDGAFADYCLIDAGDCHDVSASPLSDVEIAAMPCAFATAEVPLDRIGVATGDRVLITGASGGVGLAAVQLAALRGAHVTGICAPAKAAAVRAAGAAVTLDRDAVLPENCFDAVIDVVGGPTWPALMRALKPGGHYGVSGAIAGPMVEADLRDIYLKDLTLHGCTYQSRQIFSRLIQRINDGLVRPLISRTYPLRDIALAQADFQSKSMPGKLVLIPEKATA